MSSSSTNQVESLEWSDEEFDYQRRVDDDENISHDVKTLRYPPTQKPDVMEHYPNKIRPKLFYGDVKTDNAKAYPVQIALDVKYPNHAGLQVVKPKPPKKRINLHESIPVVSANLVMKLTMSFVVGIWDEYKRIINEPNLSIEESLLPVNRLPNILQYINEKYGFQLEIKQIPELKKLEDDDYIEFASVVTILERYVDPEVLVVYEQDHNPEVIAERTREVLCHICCAYASCNCKGKFPDKFHNFIQEGLAKLKQRQNQDKEGDEEKDGEGSKPEEGEGEGEGDDDDDDSDDGILSSTTKFRLKIVHNRLQHQLQGKVRVRHVIPMLKELNIPYFPNRIPKEIWDNYDTFYLDDLKSLQDLLVLLCTEEEPEKDPLDHLYKYPLPAWLKNEFKTSEILLFQHQFTLIDIDGGGSVDAFELQQLLSAFGSIVTVEEAQAIVDKYDIDGSGTVDFVEFMILIYKIQRGTIDMVGNDLAQALMEAKAQLRIFEEIEEVNLHPPEFVHVGHFGGRVVVCDFIIYGPPGTQYEDRGIPMKMTFHDGYPYRPPKVEFNARIFHINIMNQLDGNAHLLHLHEVWGSDWSIVKLLDHVVQLLREPLPLYLPKPFNELYSTLEKEYAMIQKTALFEESQQSIETPGADGVTRGLDYDQSTMASSRSTVLSDMMKNKFLKLNRVETMHLSVIYLYVFDQEAYGKLALTSGKSKEEIEEERKKEDEEEGEEGKS